MQAIRTPASIGDAPPPELPDIPTGTLQLGTAAIHYADLPARGREVGPPLLWVHGLGGWLRNWAPNVHHFTESGYRCVALDLPGFGDSSKPNVSYNARYFRARVGEFLDALDIPRATFIGNSMGGMISLAMAVRNPERVDRLVLVDAAGVRPLAGTAVRVTMDLTTAIVRHGARIDRIMRAMRHWVFEVEPPELLAELRLEFAKYGQEDRRARGRRARSYTRALWNIMRTNFRPWLPTITAPTLVVHGREDKLVPFEAASIMHREIPGARLVTFDGIGHCPQLETPAKFNTRLQEFLASTNGA